MEEMMKRTRNALRTGTMAAVREETMSRSAPATIAGFCKEHQ